MKYSILIPAYKAKFFYECLDSALNQSFKDYEVIILNDASPEDLDSIVGTFHDNRIRYYKNEVNVGAINVVDNWNTLLSLAKGDFVACIGDDDKLYNQTGLKGSLCTPCCGIMFVQIVYSS